MDVSQRIRQVTGIIQELEGIISEEGTVGVETQRALNDLLRATNMLYRLAMTGYTPNPPQGPGQPYTVTAPTGQTTPQPTTYTYPCPNCQNNITLTLT